MKDFTKKGTKLPVIPVGTEFKWFSDGELIEPCEELVSKGMFSSYDNFLSLGYISRRQTIYVICNIFGNKGTDYAIKLSTIERLAKEQRMCNTNNEIKMKTEFKTGDYVRVIRNGANASGFTLKIPSCGIKGVYSMVNWKNAKFQILGNYEPITFNSSPKIYGAYPLSIDGKLIGYVYNDALQHYSEMNPTIKLQENGTVTVTDTETTTTLSKVTVDEICRLVKDDGDKVKLEVGKYYRSVYIDGSENKALFYITEIKGDVFYAYGFDYLGNWSNESYFGELGQTGVRYEIATPETVEQYLRDEFIRLGFKKGCKVKCTYFTWEVIGKTRFEFDVEKNQLLLFSSKVRCIETGSVYETETNLTVFDKGKFATIIQPETITRAEAEKRYDVKITD